MTGVEVLTTLKSRGVILEPDGPDIRYKAPRGAVTPELRQAMADHKAEILTQLRRRVKAAEAEPASPPDYAATACVCPVPIGGTGPDRCGVCDLPLICPGCGRCRGCKLRLRFPPGH